MNVKSVMLFYAVLWVLLAPAAQAATIEVTSRENSGAGTLRQAVLDAVAGDTITFGAAVSGNANSITVFSPIEINKAITIDGESNSVVVGYYPAMSSNTTMLWFTTNGSNATLRNLALVNAYRAVRVNNANNLTIAGCRIGLDWTDTVRANYDGVYFLLALGGSVGTADPADRNIISGNSHYGISMAYCTGVRVQNNYIGLDSTGLLARPNLIGIEVVDQCMGNMIGGNWHNNEGNWISGHTNAGIRLSQASTSGNSICGNVIGLGSDMATELGNSFAGVHVGNFSQHNWIGLPVEGYGNTISANDRGIYSYDTTPHHYIIQNNCIYDNANYGIHLGGYSYYIGGNLDAGYLEHNWIAGNQYNIRLDGAGSTVCGNVIGTNQAGDAAWSANQYGILVYGEHNWVGGLNLGGSPRKGNVISGASTGGNVGVGIYGSSNSVTGNVIGLNLAGDAAIPNYSGIRIYSAGGNLIGGEGPEYRNVISGNSEAGVFFELAPGNTVTGNDIGLNLARTAVIANGDGVVLGGAVGNLIGGYNEDARNYIYAVNDGFDLYAGADDNVILNNWVNLLPDGTATGATTNMGVRISDGQDNLFGLKNTGPGNIFSAMNYGFNIYTSSSVQNGLFANTLTAISAYNIILQSGGNAGKAAPVISSAMTILIEGTASANDYIEVFESEAGGIEGGAVRLVGRTTADGSGNWSLIPSGLLGGETVSALSTDSSNNTSSFAADVLVLVPTPTITPTSTVTPTLTATPTISPTLTVTATVTETATISPTLTVTPTITATPTATPSPDQSLASVELGGRPAIAFPNPAKQSMQFVFTMENAGTAEIQVYNLAGERIAVLQSGLPAGPGQAMSWNCAAVAPGIYIARILVDGREKGKIKVGVVQ